MGNPFLEYRVISPIKELPELYVHLLEPCNRCLPSFKVSIPFGSDRLWVPHPPNRTNLIDVVRVPAGKQIDLEEPVPLKCALREDGAFFIIASTKDHRGSRDEIKAIEIRKLDPLFLQYLLFNIKRREHIVLKFARILIVFNCIRETERAFRVLRQIVNLPFKLRVVKPPIIAFANRDVLALRVLASER